MLKDSKIEVCLKCVDAEELFSAVWRVALLERNVAEDTPWSDQIRSCSQQLVLWLEIELGVCILSVQDYINARIVAIMF